MCCNRNRDRGVEFETAENAGQGITGAYIDIDSVGLRRTGYGLCWNTISHFGG